MFASLDRITADIRKSWQQLQNLAKKYAFLRPEKILGVGDEECNLDQALQDITREEFKLECVRLRAFVSATNCEKELIDSGPLRLHLLPDLKMGYLI